MTALRQLLLVTLLVLVAFGTAHAASVLTTPPVLGDRVTCLIANTGTESITVTIDLVGSTTINLVTNSVLAAGGFEALGAGDDDIAYCRFTITQGIKRGVRASACGISSALGNKCATSADAR